MTNAQALLRLSTWLSPAFPTGGFAWSGGLEAAAHDGVVTSADDLRAWCEHALRHGTLRTDATLLACAWRGEDVSDLAAALAPCPERLAETLEQGAAFARAAAPWVPVAVSPLPVAVGHAAREADLPLEDTLIAFLNAAIMQQVQAAQRLARIGQADAMATLAALEGTILSAAEAAAHSTIDDLGSAAPMIDICAMRHATLPSRIFRS